MLRIRTATGYEYTFHVAQVTDQYSKTVNSVAIVSLPTDSTFVLETGCKWGYSIKFFRRHPDTPDDTSPDSERWSNATWSRRVSTLADRWQIRTNGYRMDLEPPTGPDRPGFRDGGPNTYIPTLHDLNVFVAGLSTTLREDQHELLEGEITLVVGGLRAMTRLSAGTDGQVTSPPSAAVVGNDLDGMWVAMSNAWLDEGDYQEYYLQSPVSPREGPDWDAAVNRDGDILTEYRFEGGSENPFEKIVLTLSRKALARCIPALAAKNGILAGRNIISVRGVYASEYVVTKVRMSGDNYTVTGYCLAEAVRSYVLPGDVYATPMEFVQTTLTEPGKYGLPTYAVFDPSKIITNVTERSGGTVAPIMFRKGANVWTLLQMCALSLNARLFFCNGCAYLWDYTNPADGSYEVAPVDLSDCPDGGAFPSGDPSFSQEGADTVVNLPRVRFTPTIPSDYIDGGGELRLDPDLTEDYVASGGSEPMDLHFTDADPVTVTPDQGWNLFNHFGMFDDDVEADRDMAGYRARSIDRYGERPQDIDLSDLVGVPRFSTVVVEGASDAMRIGFCNRSVMDFANGVATSLLVYKGEAQHIVTARFHEFLVKDGEVGWYPRFEPTSAVSSISADFGETVEDDSSDLGAGGGRGEWTHDPAKLRVTGYERVYPGGYTTYTLGEYSQIDLAQSTSQILSTKG